MTETPSIGVDLRAALVAMVRKRVPESEVEDIVQSTLAEAFESVHAPKEQESLRRWLFGVAKYKVIDYHRRAGRESFELPDVGDEPAPHVEADLLRWAERNLPPGADAKKTLDWMIREGDGEKLESIAESEKVPAPRVRQRVSRLRRHLKDHWAKEVALLAALGIVSAIVLLVRPPKPDPIVHDPNVVPLDPRAEPIRRGALERCAAQEWARCVEGLDEAKRLDPAGDARPDVREAREAARKALTLPPAPLPLPSSAPSPAPSTQLAPEPSAPPSKSIAPITKPKALPSKPVSTATPPPAPAPKSMNKKGDTSKTTPPPREAVEFTKSSNTK